jgi:Bacterial membrane protein YfhO
LSLPPVKNFNEDQATPISLIDQPSQSSSFHSRVILRQPIDKTRWERSLAALALTLLPLIYFSPAVIGRTVLVHGDSLSYSILMRMFSGEMLAAGVFPMWNPHTFGGMPLFAAIQPGVLYPANWGFAILPTWIAMNLLVITTYHVALIGTYLYARAIRLNVVGALVAASAFTFGGFMICQLEQINFIAAAAWLPWVLLSIEKIRRSRSWREAWRWVVGGSVVIVLQVFAGLPQATWLIIMVSGPYLLFSLIARVDPGQNRLRFVSAVAAMCACGALLSSIQLLPSFELQQQGVRAAIDYETFAMFPMEPRYWLRLIFPFFYGDGLPPYKIGLWDSWSIKWACTYIGLLGLLLVLVAWFARERRALVCFWTIAAVCAMVLATGDNLPFGMNHLLYQVPVNNLFRGSFRHIYEFTFALAVIAGIGTDSLARLDWVRARRALWRASLTLAVVVGIVALIYRFFAHRLGADEQPAAGANSLANLEVLVPLSMLILSVAVTWFYARRQTLFAGLVLLAALTLDLASFGWFTYWNVANGEILKSLSDPPAVEAIKLREEDLQSFRVVSNAPRPYQDNYGPLNHANLSIARGLQSASGYDPMRPTRPAALAGEMDIFGIIHDYDAFSASDQGFNLLNVKYLLQEQERKIDPGRDMVITHDGIHFRKFARGFTIDPNQHNEMSPGGPTIATELAMVTTLANANHLPDGTPIARIKLHSSDGQVIERELQAGRDTSEWAYGHAEALSRVKHRRARIAESWQENDFPCHRYLTRLKFNRTEIERVELDSLRPDSFLVIVRAVLFDEITASSVSLESPGLPRERWRLLGTFGEIGLYENLKALPRAWFVRRVEALPSAEVLRVIKQGKFADGTIYDPSEVALFEKEDFDGRETKLPEAGVGSGAEVKVIRYEPQRVELETRNSEQGFLVLSEVYYRGWDAKIDGVKVPVERVDYALRGIPVPAGDHRVEFFFRAPSFWNGAVYSSLGAILLLAGSIFIGIHRKNRARRLLC